MQSKILIASSIFVILLCICAIVLTNTKHTVIAKYIRRAIFISIIITICNIISSIETNLTIASIAASIYYALFDWQLLFLFLFSIEYTQFSIQQKNYRLMGYILYALATIDSCSFLLNPLFQHIFTVEANTALGTIYYHPTNFSILFSIHLVYCYILVVLFLFMFIYRMRKLPTIYKKQYLPFLLVFLGIVIFNAIYLFLQLNFDFSVLLYALGGIVLAYFSLFHKPMGVFENTMIRVSENLNNALACFDIYDECLYYNNQAKTYLKIEDNKVYLDNYIKNWLKDNKDVKENKWELRNTKTKGFPKHLNIEFQRLYDRKQKFIGYYFLYIDVTDEVEKYERERYRANHDPLTGIYNRLYFLQKAEETITSHPETQYCFAVSNIVDFKLVNNLFGEKKGNEVLIQQATFLRESCQPGSVYGRLYADQFAVCIPKDRFVPERFLARIQELANIYDNSLYHMRIKVGIYTVKDPHEPVVQMVDKAFLALRSNTNDLNKVFYYYDDELFNKTLFEKSIINGFDVALKNGQFQIYLQPQIEATTKNVVGCEALVRWIMPNGKMVPPNDFIPILENKGMIHLLDRYVWEQAARKIKEWNENGIQDIHISVNVSTKDFYYLDVYTEFTTLVETYHFDPSLLHIEITETALMTEIEKQYRIIDDLRKYGFKVEIDDFGSGYSSLGQLKNLNVDVVKVDMSFLGEATDTNKARLILHTTIQLMEKLDLQIVVEGVETKEQVEFLNEAGCDIFQGYYFSKPIPISQFEQAYIYKKQA